jgi:hypothetical protein
LLLVLSVVALGAIVALVAADGVGTLVAVMLVRLAAVVVAAMVVVDVTNGEVVDCVVPVGVLAAEVPLVPNVVPAVVPEEMVDGEAVADGELVVDPGEMN